MIPYDQNLFDGLKYQKVMIDTGCQMIAIPFPFELPFDVFWNKYKNYILRIHKSSGRGHLSKLSLVVEGDTPNSFQIILGKDKIPITLQKLRFILNYDIAVELLKTNRFQGASLDYLKEYIQLIGKLEPYVPSLKEIPKNGVVLVGQEILQSFYVLQLQYVTLVLTRKTKLSFRPLLIEQEYIEECQKFETNFKEIYDCFEGKGEDNLLFGWSPGYHTNEEDYSE